MLSKILGASVVVLLLSLGTVGYLYKQEIAANAALSTANKTLTADLGSCREQKKNVEEDKADVVTSFEVLDGKNEKTDKDFKTLEDELLKMKNSCRKEKKVVTPGVAKNVEPEIDAPDPFVVDDINRVLGVLSNSYCLSNGSCERP